MKKALHITGNIIQFLIIIYVLLVTTFMFFSNRYGYTEIGNYVFNNLDNGDLSIIKKDTNIKENDTIYYYSSTSGKYQIVSNKVISMTKDDKNSIYRVEDDSVSSTNVIGKKDTRIKVLGSILRVLESKIGFLFLVLLPILVVFVCQVYSFITTIHHKE